MNAEEARATLVVRACGGCELAFTQLDQYYRPRLIRFLSSRLSSQEDAEDVAQETMMKAWQALERYSPSHSFSTWLYTIAIRTGIDWTRKKKRHATGTSQQTLSSIPDTSANPEQFEELQEQQEQLWQIAKRHLSAKQFEVLWLHYGEGLSPSEIAQVMQRSAIGIRVGLHRARNTLQKHYVA